MIERIPAWSIDVGIAGAVTLLATGNALVADRPPLVDAAVIAGSLVLVLRRRRPLLVLALVTAGSFALALAGSAGLVLSILVAMYAVGSFVPRQASLPYAAGSLVVASVRRSRAS